MPKYHRFLKDGFVMPYNEQLADDPKFQAFETDGDPNLPMFLAPETDEQAEAKEARALEAARALIARADAKAKAAEKTAK